MRRWAGGGSLILKSWGRQHVGTETDVQEPMLVRWTTDLSGDAQLLALTYGPWY